MPEMTAVSNPKLVIVPLTYRLFRGRRALLATDVILTVGALSAAFGIIQYLILNFDNLGQRPHGTLGLYMTYSGLLMLVTCAAAEAAHSAIIRQTTIARFMAASCPRLAPCVGDIRRQQGMPSTPSTRT